MVSSCNPVFISQQLEAVIRARIPSITSLINKTIDELESEMDHLGRPIGSDAGVINETFELNCIGLKQTYVTPFMYLCRLSYI
jgi:hypothetical protein